MKRFLLIILLLLITVPLAAQQPDFDSLIAECQTTTDPSTCLGDVAYRAGDVSLCALADDAVHCREVLAESVALICQDQSDSQQCFGSWGVQGVESACTYLPPEQQAECFVIAAAQSRDFDIIERHFPEGEDRDTANAMVAVLATEPDLLADIDDNRTYDNAYVYMIITLGIGEEVALPDDYCVGLRGNYSDEYAEDAQSTAALCEESLAAINAWQQADEDERAALLDDMLAALAEGGEEAALAILRDSLFRNPLEEAFVRGWCRADENGICIDGAVPIMEYDAEIDVIVHFPRNGPPRFYEPFGDNTYRMYYDTEITNDDDETVIVRWYGEIIVESPERFSWQFYNHLERGVGTFSYYVPSVSEDAVAD